MSDINIAAVDSLKVLDPNRPIREADEHGRDRFRPRSPIPPYAPQQKLRCSITSSTVARSCGWNSSLSAAGFRAELQLARER